MKPHLIQGLAAWYTLGCTSKETPGVGYTELFPNSVPSRQFQIDIKGHPLHSFLLVFNCSDKCSLLLSSHSSPFRLISIKLKEIACKIPERNDYHHHQLPK